MKKNITILALIILGIFGSKQIFSQETDWGDLLIEEVVVENPVYKPVISLGAGILTFYGDINSDFKSVLNGKPAYRLNVTSFLDKKHYLQGNIYGIMGETYGRDNSRHLNFKTDALIFGFNIHYEFDNFRKGQKRVTPFISIGVENVQFSPKGDLYYNTTEGKSPYYYWNDGTVRKVPEGSVLGSEGHQFVRLDDEFETDLQKATEQDYSLNTFAIPVEIGLNFKIADRTTIRFGTSFHYTFTDYLDNLSSKPVSIEDQNDNALSNWNNAVGDSKNDALIYTYFSIHLDLWSDPETIMQEKLFAEVDFDYDQISDEDNDLVFDQADECPGTPLGVQVDSVGCPYDDDYDGIPNYMDKEFDTPRGAMVDKEGVQMSDEDVIALIDNSNAVARKDVYDLDIDSGWSKYGRVGNQDIPPKFKFVDSDGDGYISFTELMSTIDSFFDNPDGGLTSEDIYELNEFFFQQ